MDNNKKWADFIARYYGDESFASEVDKDPTVMMRKHGFDVPDGKTICLHKNTDDTLNFVLPPSPMSEIDSEDMGKIFGGCCSGGQDWCSTNC